MDAILNHCSDERVAADYELSERLGRELEAAGSVGELNAPVAAPALFYTRYIERFSVRCGELTISGEWVTEPA